MNMRKYKKIIYTCLRPERVSQAANSSRGAEDRRGALAGNDVGRVGLWESIVLCENTAQIFGGENDDKERLIAIPI